MICEQLSQYVRPSQAALYQQRIEELDTPIRIATHELQGRVSTVTLPDTVVQLLDVVKRNFKPTPVDSSQLHAAQSLKQQYETSLQQLQQLVSAFKTPSTQGKAPKARDVERSYRAIIQVYQKTMNC